MIYILLFLIAAVLLIKIFMTQKSAAIHYIVAQMAY